MSGDLEEYSVDGIVLDEADYLGDNVAILQAPGRLLALDGPVALKTRLGRGFSVAGDLGLLLAMRQQLPSVTSREVRGKHVFATSSNDIGIVRKLVLQLQTERAKGTANYSYQINSATLDEVFIDLNAERQEGPASSASTLAVPLTDNIASTGPLASDNIIGEKMLGEKDLESAIEDSSMSQDRGLVLTPGRKPTRIRALFADAYTIFLKRCIVARRSWLLSIVAIIIVICASCIPLFFIKDRQQTCAVVLNEQYLQQLTYPYSYYLFAESPVVLAPAALAQTFGAVPNAEAYTRIVADNASFVSLFETDYTNLTFGGLSLASGSAQSLFAFEGSALENKGLSALNLLNNVMLDEISPSAASPFRINLSFRYLASPSFASTASAFKWLAFV